MSEAEQITNEPEVEASAENENVDTETGLSYEDEARTMGWVPADEFRGDPDRHVSAERFVERGRESIPLLKSNLNRMQADMADLRGLVESERTAHQKAMQDQQSHLRADYERQMREAVTEGDTAAYDALAAQRDSIQPVTATPAAPTGPSPADQFAAENTWYGTDAAMTGAADAISADIARQFPNMTVEQNLVRTKAQVEQEFAHKMNPTASANTNRRAAPTAVEGARRGGKTKNARGYDNLPDDAKQAFQKFARMKVFTNDDAGKKAYVASYDWD